MSTTKPQLHRIDLTANSRETLAVLIKLLAPHIPYSIHILGAILNVGSRASKLQDIDPSKVYLWSTIPLHPDAIFTSNQPALFSIVTFSHIYKQFSVFCSSESSTSSEPPTKAEKTHIQHVFEHIRNMAREARPMYDAEFTPPESVRRALSIELDAPMIAVGAVHAKWAEALKPLAAWQSAYMRYASPPGALAACVRPHLETQALEGLEVSEIRESDLPFIHGASSTTRSDAYLLSRAPYSVCLRVRGNCATRGDEDLGSPVACVLLHAGGSIGALRVDAKYQRRGLGKLVLRMLAERLDFNQGRGDLGLILDNHWDLGGGALGWNWMDTEAQGKANHFFTSVIGGKRGRLCHWTFIQID